MKRLVAAVVLVTAAACLAPPLRVQAHFLKTVLRESSRALVTTSFEQRRRTLYGDCDKHGYGYIRRMIVGFPDARAHPLLRNPRWDPRLVPVVLPGFRWNVDPRALIAVGVTEDDTRESTIAHAERRDTDERGTEAWSFATREDFDLLTAVVLTLPPHARPEAPASVALTLVHSFEYPGVMERWEFHLSPRRSPRVELRLPRPFVDFSFGRPTLPFVLRVEARGGPGPLAIDVLGVKVNTGGYVVVNREGPCLTAVRGDLLQGLRDTDRHLWSAYVAAIRNAGSD